MDTLPTANATYSPPVDQLLSLGDCRGSHWPNYGAMSFAPEHVPELIRMATDPGLDWGGPDSVEVWAPIHAWRVLGLLRAEKAIEPLLRVFDEWEDSDWPANELPHVFGLIGPQSILPITRFVADRSRDEYPRTAALSGLTEIARHWPKARAECVSVLTRLLDDPAEEGAFQSFVVCELMDLEAVEAAAIIERAYDEERIDISIPGDWEDVQVRLGLLAARITPRPRYHIFPGLVPFRDRETHPSAASRRRDGEAARQAAAKRKREKEARRKNRRRK